MASPSKKAQSPSLAATRKVLDAIMSAIAPFPDVTSEQKVAALRAAAEMVSAEG